MKSKNNQKSSSWPIRQLNFTKSDCVSATYNEQAKMLAAIQRHHADGAQRLLPAHIEISKHEVRKVTLGEGVGIDLVGFGCGSEHFPRIGMVVAQRTDRSYGWPALTLPRCPPLPIIEADHRGSHAKEAVETTRSREPDRRHF